MRRVPFPRSGAGRALLAFWAALLLACAGLAVTLQWLGPPPGSPASPKPSASASRPVVASTKPMASIASGKPSATVPAAAAYPNRDRPDIVPPDAALLEPAPHDPGALLPRIATDKRQARLLYAARVPPMPEGSKRVAILLSGVGLSIAGSLDAVDRLPAAVSLAVSPYAEGADIVLDAARKAGHELLLSLPMEPAGSPLDDEGGKALSDQFGPDENALRLEWSLSRIQGYAGVTNDAGGLAGESFAGSPQFLAVVRAIAGRGLFYLDATPDGVMPAGIEGAKADLRLDGPESAPDINRQLETLAQTALAKGSAIGVVGPLFPVNVERLAEWTSTLPARGLVLVPVSSLVHPPDPVPGKSKPGESAPGKSTQ